MSYAATVRAFAEDAARAKVYPGTYARRLQSYGQTAQQHGKGTVAFRNAIDKLVPEYVAKLQAEKYSSMIAELERVGYTVTKNTETQGA